MQISSLSIIRHSSPLFLRRASIHHGGHGARLGIGIRRSFHLLTLSARRDNPDVSRKPQPSKNMLRAKHIGKDHSSLAPVLSPDHNPSLLPSQAIGTVATAQANFMRVVVKDGDGEGDDRSSSSSSSKDGVELLCVVRAVLKKIRRRVLVGDKVLVGSIDWVDRRGMIENVFQRRSEILDPPVANVDHLLVLFSLDQPKLEPFTLTRFLVEAESTGIPLTLALNKCELITEEELESWKMRLRGWNYEPFFCSVGTKEGLDAIAFVLRNQTSVIVGPSGVGKSSLINILRSSSGGGDVEEENWFEPIIGNKWFEDQRVGEVSTRSGRGKHTTRNVSLLPITEGGYLADTPGFNQPSLLKVTKHSLALCFPEIRKMIEEEKCGFKDCLHIGEPGCVVKGEWERYPYYLQLLDEIRVREEFQLRTFGTKREGDVRYKVGGMGVKQAEPRLQPKKHRRESRKKVKQTMISELDEYEDEERLSLTKEKCFRVHFRSVSVAVMSRRYSPPYYSPPRRGYGGRGRSPPPPPPSRRGYGGGGRKGSSHGSLLVRNIPLDCRPEELRVPFERFGPVRDVYIPRDYYSGEPRGFAFVEFVDAYDAGEAQRSMNRRIFGGREITVVVASESRKRPEEMRVKTRTRSREPSGSRGRSHGRSRSRSISRSRSPRRPSDSRSRRRSRSYSPAPRRRGADYSASPRRRQEERPRSPLRSPPRGEGDAKYSRRSYSPGYEGAAAGDRDANGDNETREKPDYEPEERRRGGREVSRSPSGSRSRSVEASPR